MRYYCKKQNKIVDIHSSNCDDCIEKSKSGFVDKLTCQQFNLEIIEESTNEL